jgi:hypothetical protein
VLASQIHFKERWRQNSMQKTLNIHPTFTWQENSLFSGTVLIAQLQYRCRANGHDYYEIKHAAFPDALDAVGYEFWESQSFILKGKTLAEVTDTVTQFYTTVFDEMRFAMTIH